VIPAYNEGANLSQLVTELMSGLDCWAKLTVIIVDDGSNDTTGEVLRELSARYENLHTICLDANKGKATALRVGFESAIDRQADVVCMIDADGQDNPYFLNLMIQRVLTGTGLVTGRRVNRAEKLPKRLASKIFNTLVRLMTSTPGRDHNSGMKAMSTDVAAFLIPLLEDDKHRYISVFAHWGGFALAELSVINRPRISGKSKYSSSRIIVGTADLLTLNQFFKTRRLTHGY
jgi:glycosyltransferase involved in cell wall biosynthesis